jgi:hypothetical protein
MFETRYVSWGISKVILFVMGLLPLLFVLAFHEVSLELVISGIFLALFWVFVISRGYYQFSKIYFWGVLSVLTVELIFALRDKNFIQMSLGILFVLSLLALFDWLEKQMVRAQYSPGIKWYEGLPQFFPKVQIEVFWDQQWHRASLRRIDDFGMFVFLQKSEQVSGSLKVDSTLKKSTLPLKIQYRDHFFEGDAKLQSVFYERWLGMGLQICPKDLYHFTQYSKIVQNLKGEGYAT